MRNYCKNLSENDDETKWKDLVSSEVDEDSVKGFIFAVAGCLLVLTCAIVWYFLSNQ